MTRLYGALWQKARAQYLSERPLCVMCEQAGRLAAASVVDHRIPHKGDAARFWDQANWQPLCKRCHDAGKQSQDRTGRVRGADVNGRPLDPSHPWNRGHPPKGGV